MNGLFELDQKWKSIIDYDETFLKEYQVETNTSTDKTVVAFLNDVCNSLNQDFSVSKIADPKPYIRLLENCNKEIAKKIATNSLDSYKYKPEQIIEQEKQFNKLITNKFEPTFQTCNKHFETIEKKLNKILTNNNVNSNNKELSKGLLNLLQNLQIKLEKNNKYISNVKLLRHYEYFTHVAKSFKFENSDELENIYDSHVSPEYKFEIVDLDAQQLKIQGPINTKTSVVLTRLCKLAAKLNINNSKNDNFTKKVNELIFYTKSQFENSMMEDFTLLYENLCNNDTGEHDEEVIYTYLNLIISLLNNMRANNDSLIDIFVDMHPFLKNLHFDDEKSISLYASILAPLDSGNSIEINLTNDFHDAKFETFLAQILKLINKEIGIIRRIFTEESLFLDTCNKFIKRIILTKVKPVCSKVITYAINNLQAIQYLKVLQSYFNFLFDNLSPIVDVFKFVENDIESFIKQQLLGNFDKKHCQLYLNKSINMMTSQLKNISTQQLPPSSLNELKVLLKKNEKKNYISILNEGNKESSSSNDHSETETPAKLLNSFGQRTLTQFNSLLKHNDLGSDNSASASNDTVTKVSNTLQNKSMSPSLGTSKDILNIDNFSIVGLIENVIYLYSIQKDLFSSSTEDLKSSKEQLLVSLNGLIDNYFIRNFEIFYHYYKNNLVSGISIFSKLIFKQQSQLKIYFKTMINLFDLKEQFIDYSLLSRIEKIINMLYIQTILEFDYVIEKALKLQSKKTYIINNKSRGTSSSPETTQTLSIITNTVADVLSQFEEYNNINNLLEILLGNLFTALLKNYKKFDVNPAGGLLINSEIVNLYNTIEAYQSTVVNNGTLDNFKLLKELVAIFTMNDMNSVRYLVENSIYLKKRSNINLNEYIKRRVSL
ncbi:hypothetical protein QEN19_001819 [Hanseniaspora menglaensis]